MLFSREFCGGTSSNEEETRLATVNIIRNCCFEVSEHFDLLAHTQIVERILILLVGPEGIEDDDEMTPVPPLLQEHLTKPDLQIEGKAETRRSVVDTLLMLANTRQGRILLRKRKCYPVIKAYHAEEENDETSEVVFRLVDLLLGEEDYKDMTEEEQEAEKRKIAEALSSKTEEFAQVEKDDNSTKETDNDSPSIVYEVD